MVVDLLLLSRDLAPLRDDVWQGVKGQEGVQLQVHRITGSPLAGDQNRYETIARARNAGKGLGSSPSVMFLDDDVVLGPRCVSQLVEGLQERVQFAGLGADSAGEMNGGWDHWDYPVHVGMAAVLFRRERLEQVTFRWEPGKCECRCCCDDLRRAGYPIGYLRGAEAWHQPLPLIDTPRLTEQVTPAPQCPARSAVTNHSGRILAAFDRKHLRLFMRRFLASLRATGNPEPVTAVTYGLYPSEQRVLAATPGVDVFVAHHDGHPAQRRLRDFQTVIAKWPEETPVAYWDAADVVFQGRIAPLWNLVITHHHRLLTAREAVELGDSTVALDWVQTIGEPEARQRALDLLLDRPVLNSGFAAGTAQAMLRYLKGAEQILHSSAFQGSTDWGDQTAMNLFCHTHPETWVEVPSSWNYCLVGVKSTDYHISPSGQTTRLDGQPLHVVHGAGGTLRLFDLVHLNA